jgi:hypothetical protein
MNWRKLFLLALLAGPAMFSVVGCEVDADDDGAKIEIGD